MNVLALFAAAAAGFLIPELAVHMGGSKEPAPLGQNFLAAFAVTVYVAYRIYA